MATKSDRTQESKPAGPRHDVVELYEWRLFVARPQGQRASVHALGIDPDKNAVRVSSPIVSVDPDGWLCRTRLREYRMLGEPVRSVRPQVVQALDRWRFRYAKDVTFLDEAAELSRREVLTAAAAFLVANVPDERRRDVIQDMLASGALVTAAEASRRLGRREEEVARQTHRLFSLAAPDGTTAYPAFLFDDVLLRNGLGQVIATLQAVDPWTKWLFFTSPSPALGGMTPLDALRAGRSDATKSVLKLSVAKARRKR